MKKLLFLLLIIIMYSCDRDHPKIEIIENENLTQHQIDSILTNFKFEYDKPVFIDSTSQVLLPITTQHSERKKTFSRYSGDEYSWADYPRYWNILFYDKNSNQTRLLTESKMRITDYIVNIKETGAILSKSILYKIGDIDYNNDKKLNHNDPEHLFISRTDGTEFKRLSPKNEDLISYTLIPKSDQIMIETIRDTNSDLEFKPDDEKIWYLINLSSDVKPIEIINSGLRKKIENLYFEQWLKKK
ncbi:MULTISPECIES: hypothetical protein [Aquimarina]|uniref:hypothetical protein n=1 Tax=Aquimarina TaxID=290174 RepID=UPI0013590992|nr:MULTISPECIES: hypothetical protein [Aquimarina]